MNLIKPRLLIGPSPIPFFFCGDLLSFTIFEADGDADNCPT